MDKDLADNAERLRVEDLAPPQIPLILGPAPTAGSVGGVDRTPDGAIRVRPDQRGRRRDELRATWGVHIKSGEHVPGGLR